MDYMFRLFFLVCGLIFLSAVHAQKTQTPKNTQAKANSTKLEYDTVYKGWVQYRTEEIDLVYTDKKGSLYSKIKTNDGLRIMKLVSDQWVDIQGNIKDNYCYLFEGPESTLYLRSNKIVYRQTANGWEKAWSEEDIYTSYFGQNGKLYGYKKNLYSSNERLSVVSYENGNWKVCGKDEFLVVKDRYGLIITPELTIDKYGNIYLAHCIEYSPQSGYNPTRYVYNIKKWNGTTWSLMAEKIDRVRYMDLDANGDLYIQVLESGVYRLKKWDPAMQNWKPISIPQKINSIEFITRIKNGQLYLCGQQIDESNILLYKYINGSWVLDVKWKKDKPFDTYYNFYPTVKAIYAIADNKLYQFDKSPIVSSHSVTSLQPIPLSNVSADIPEISALYGKMGIFVENGKKGIKDKYGNVIIHPVFDEISIERAPQKYWKQEKYNYAFRLKNGSDNLLCAYAVTGPTKLYGFIDTLVSCQECGGKGKIKDRIEKVLVPGESVPGKEKTTTKTVPVTTSERVWNPQTKQYDDVQRTTYKVVENTTTEKAYRKEDTYKNEVIKGGTCKVCKGWALKLTRNDYEYNPTLKKYQLKQIEYKDYNID